MKKLLVIGLLLALCFIVVTTASADQVTYAGPYTLTSPSESRNWDDVWDLTKGDVVLSYTIDMSNLHQPPQPTNVGSCGAGSPCCGTPDGCICPSWWNNDWGPCPTNYGAPEYTWYYWGHTVWTEVGMRGVGGSNFDPGPSNTYRGKCGGWMVHDPDAWLGNW